MHAGERERGRAGLNRLESDRADPHTDELAGVGQRVAGHLNGQMEERAGWPRMYTCPTYYKFGRNHYI